MNKQPIYFDMDGVLVDLDKYAVSQQMAPSSFCEAELYKDLKLPRYGTCDYELTDAIPIIYSEF